MNLVNKAVKRDQRITLSNHLPLNGTKSLIHNIINKATGKHSKASFPPDRMFLTKKDPVVITGKQNVVDRSATFFL